jgi:hypothetical protein
MLTGGTQGVVLYREFRARAGEKRKILAWLLGDGYQVESLARCGGDSMVTLRVEVRALPGTVVFVDDLDDWPAADILSFHGLHCEDRVVPSWQVGDDGGSWGSAISAGHLDNGFAADQIPNLYLLRTPTNYKRWHLINLLGEHVAPELGELVLAQVTQLQSTADWGAELRVVEANIRNEVGDGDVQAFGHARWPRRALGLRWQHPERTTGGALSRMREARDEFWGRARGGRHNVLLVPRTDENTSTCYGSRTTGPPAASSTSSRTTSSS